MSLISIYSTRDIRIWWVHVSAHACVCVLTLHPVRDVIYFIHHVIRLPKNCAFHTHTHCVCVRTAICKHELYMCTDSFWWFACPADVRTSRSEVIKNVWRKERNHIRSWGETQSILDGKVRQQQGQKKIQDGAQRTINCNSWCPFSTVSKTNITKQSFTEMLMIVFQQGFCMDINIISKLGCFTHQK